MFGSNNTKQVIMSGRTEHVITHEMPYKVELARGQRGSYGWTITVYDSDPSALVSSLESIDNRLKDSFTEVKIEDPSTEATETTEPSRAE